MQAIKLSAEIREVTGKKIKKLRQAGFVPVNVYGKGVESQALQIPLKEFLIIYSKVGETGLVELTYGKTTNHVLIKNVQFNPVLRIPIHAEFHAVNLKEKIKANVPLELTGEAPAVTNGIGILLQTISEIEVEALPTNLPEKIEIDVAGLNELDQQISVADLNVPQEVAIVTSGDEVVVKVVKAVVEEVVEETPVVEGGEGGIDGTDSSTTNDESGEKTETDDKET